MNATEHIDPERLLAYMQGRLSWTEVGQVVTHVNDCSKCQARLADLDGQDDSFVSCLRGAIPDTEEDPALKRFLARAGVGSLPSMSTASLGPPKIVAGCEVLRELKRGGLGVVYLARHGELNDLRAIKRPLSREGHDREVLLDRFRREVRAVGKLRHDHIIRAHDAGSDDEGPFLVMEFIDGKSLSDVLASYGPLPVPEACELVRQAALGLQAAHERGLVHRDIKPSNLMLAPVGSGARVVVIDWGLVKWMDSSTPSEDIPTQKGAIFGTPSYMAPEQAIDASAVDGRADVYSLGATLYCLLTGKPPAHDWLQTHKQSPERRKAVPPSDRPIPEIPEKVMTVLKKMLEKDAARRYESPGEVAQVLQRFGTSESRLLALLSSEPGKKVGVPTVQDPKRLPIGWLAAAAATVLVVAVSLGAFLLLGKPAPQTSGAPDDSKRVQADPLANKAPATKPPVLGDGPDEPVSMTGLTNTLNYSPLTFTRDGLQAFSTTDGKIRLWDLQKRKVDKSEWPASHAITLSPDGKLLAAQIGDDLVLYDVSTKKKVGEPIPSSFRGQAIGGSSVVAFSPDGSLLATVVNKPGRGDTISVIDLATRKEKNNFDVVKRVNALAFSLDGKFLLSAAAEATMRLWSLADDRQEKEFKGHTAGPEWIAFSGDGKHVYSGSQYDGTLRVWDYATAKELKKINAVEKAGNITALAFTPDGRVLTGNKQVYDYRVVLWDLEEAKELKRFEHVTWVNGVAVSPDGQHAVSATNELVYLYKLPPPVREITPRELTTDSKLKRQKDPKDEKP